MKIGNEFKIGLWTIIAIAILVWGVKYLKGQLHATSTYYMLTDNVEGLAESSHVTLLGFNVGIVRTMDLDYERGKVIVVVDIDPEVKIPVDSRAVIENDMLSAGCLVLKLGTSSTLLQPGDTITNASVKPGITDQVTPVFNAVTELMPKIDTLLTGINHIVNDSKINETLLEMNLLAMRLQSSMGELNRQLPGILRQMNEATANFDSLSVQLKEAHIDEVIAHANAAIEHVDSLICAINLHDGTIGKLLDSTELHDQLTNAINDVDSLVNDIKENPKRYINVSVFGKEK